MFSIVSMTFFYGCAGAPDSVGEADETRPAEVAEALNGPITCTFLTTNGHYLTAVGGGGRTTDVIHSDATWLLDWEKLTMVSLGFGVYSASWRTHLHRSGMRM